jgi:hypothetical protein
MVARRLTPILPAMRLADARETARSPRVAGRTGARPAVVPRRPCRAPHHTISDVGLIGGGAVPLPGEVSLAQHGVLCRDARPACTRYGLDVLQSPRELGRRDARPPVRGDETCARDGSLGWHLSAGRPVAVDMTVPSIYAGGERNGEAILASTDCRAALVATAKEESAMDTHLVFENVRELSARFATERPARQQRRELGGIWESVRRSTRPLCELLRTLAHGDSSVALVCAMHPTVLVFWLAHAQVPAPFQAA